VGKGDRGAVSRGVYQRFCLKMCFTNKICGQHSCENALKSAEMVLEKRQGYLPESKQTKSTRCLLGTNLLYLHICTSLVPSLQR